MGVYAEFDVLRFLFGQVPKHVVLVYIEQSGIRHGSEKFREIESPWFGAARDVHGYSVVSVYRFEQSITFCSILFGSTGSNLIRVDGILSDSSAMISAVERDSSE